MKDQESEKVPILQDDSRSNPKYDSNMPTTSTAQLSISEENKTPSKTVHKKKQPTFLKRHIIVTNPGEVDDVELLQSMNERFTKNCETWIRKAKIFRIAHFIVVLIVILLQLSQVILLQLPISTYVQHQLATILPAITGALLGIQLKLAWSEKGIKCKKCAKLFSMLANHTKFRLEMHKAGGRSSDIETIKLWNHALLAEIEDVPTLIPAY